MKVRLTLRSGNRKTGKLYQRKPRIATQILAFACGHCACMIAFGQGIAQ